MCVLSSERLYHYRRLEPWFCFLSTPFQYRFNTKALRDYSKILITECEHEWGSGAHCDGGVATAFSAFITECRYKRVSL